MAAAELQDREHEEEDAGGAAPKEKKQGTIFQKKYLHRMIKLLKSTGREVNFGFAVNPRNPEESQLLLKRKGNPQQLFKQLKKTGDYTSKQITFGRARLDEQDGKTIVFELDAKAGEPPQILKLARVFLRSDNKLKFRKLKLVPPGGGAEQA